MKLVSLLLDFLNLSEVEILKLNEDKLQKCVLDIKNNIPPALTVKGLILNSLKEIRADINNCKMASKKWKMASHQ